MRWTSGVMIVPGSIFDAPGDHFHVGLGRLIWVRCLSNCPPSITGARFNIMVAEPFFRVDGDALHRNHVNNIFVHIHNSSFLT